MTVALSLPHHFPMGIGDLIQFTSLPENYFRLTGEKLIDLSRRWVFDKNPFVERHPRKIPEVFFTPWANLDRRLEEFQQLKSPRASGLFECNAEIWSTALLGQKGLSPPLKRPKLYHRHAIPGKMKPIIFHPIGISSGLMPDDVREHIFNKYGRENLLQVGLPGSPMYPGVDFEETTDPWELVELISHATLFIGMDSGPSWIASCFPWCLVKKITRDANLIPLKDDSLPSYFHDTTLAEFYNVTGEDRGFTKSFNKL